MQPSAPQAHPRLKIALYQPWIYLHGGLERSILELIARSRHEWVIYTGHYDPDGTFPEFKHLDVRKLGRTTIQRRIASVLWSAINVSLQKVPLDGDVDAIVVWCDGIGDMLTFRNRSRPIFNICSTPLRAVFDPAYERMALDQRGPAGRAAYRIFSHIFRYADRLAWRHYDGIVATSKEVESRILAGGLATKNRMVLCHPGVNRSPAPPPVVYEQMVLVSGRIMWTKNIELAISSFIKADLPPSWTLVIAGYVDRKSLPYLEKLRALAATRNNIEFVVSPTDAVMQALFSRASFTLFTPLNEDWGIAPLEAMAHAKPVIAVDSGGPRESVAHGVSGYLVEPDPDAWASRIASLAGDPSKIRQMGLQAHAHVERFTWERFACNVDTAIDSWMAKAVADSERREAGAVARRWGKRLRGLHRPSAAGFDNAVTPQALDVLEGNP